ncbi:glutaredoxin domain-containing protein [Sulfuriferula plumbiphila]|uniref:glutaredoxin domain-containing protein n=1 Tax=Sulfuriferula plumbiphila TaxID=171865 RepID=UPI001CB8E4BF
MVLRYRTAWCLFCMRAEQLFQCKGIGYRENSRRSQSIRRDTMIARTSRRTVPRIFVGDRTWAELAT